MPGKVDWLANNRPTEGEQDDPLTAGRMVRDDVVTCALEDRVGSVRERIERSAYGFALVTSADGVLLGRLRGSALDCDPELPAEDVMEAGPSTVRAHTSADRLAEQLAERDHRYAVVTTPEGRLVGVVRRADLESAL